MFKVPSTTEPLFLASKPIDLVSWDEDVNLYVWLYQLVSWITSVAELDDEEGEGYLDIVPDTSPEDVPDEMRKFTLSRSVQ